MQLSPSADPPVIDVGTLNVANMNFNDVAKELVPYSKRNRLQTNASRLRSIPSPPTRPSPMLIAKLITEGLEDEDEAQ